MVEIQHERMSRRRFEYLFICAQLKHLDCQDGEHRNANSYAEIERWYFDTDGKPPDSLGAAFVLIPSSLAMAVRTSPLLLSPALESPDDSSRYCVV